MYGTAGGFAGKKHSTESIKKQQRARKNFWIKHGHILTDKFEIYRNRVDVLTNKQPLHLLENNEKRGRAGVEGAYHLDHIMSVWKGFKNNIEPEKISDMSNLRFIPWLENQKKWYK